MAKLFANRGDRDQMTHSAASDQQITLLGVSGLKWLNQSTMII